MFEGMNTRFWGNGPAPGQFYNFMGNNTNVQLPKEYTSPGIYGTQTPSFTPVTTGTTVIGLKFDGGVMIAADTLISYGSLARFQDIERVFKINEQTILGAGGDYADFQSIKRSIDQKIIEDMYHSDGLDMKAKSLYNWLTRVMYNARSRIKPFWLDLIVAGLNDGEPFLGHVDMRGRAYEDEVCASGFGKHLALPLIRESLVEGQKLTQKEASELIRKAMEVLYYRDCRTISKYMVAVVSKAGSVIEGPFQVSENWALAPLIKGF